MFYFILLWKVIEDNILIFVFFLLAYTYNLCYRRTGEEYYRFHTLFEGGRSTMTDEFI